MLIQERHREILELLGETGSARVSDLARRLQVTEETIRRDLRKLHHEGKLVRAHGGAVAAEVAPERVELPFDTRQQSNPRQKKAIAAMAAASVVEGEAIALDASTTACELARQLPDMPLTVLTNSVVIAATLADRESIEVVMAGGTLDRSSLAVMDPLALEAFRRFNIIKLFISCRGVDLDRGLTEASDLHAQFKRRLMDLSEQVVLMADSSKLGLRSVVFFATLADVDVLITDQGADADTLQAYRASGLDVRTVDA